MAKRLTQSQKASRDMDKMFKTAGKIINGGKTKRKKKTKTKKLFDFLFKW